MEDQTLLTIFGGFISLLLIINAHFTRETLLRVVKIEVKLGEQNTKQLYNEKQLDENTIEIRRLRDRIHKVEGEQKQAFEYIEYLKGEKNGK